MKKEKKKERNAERLDERLLAQPQLNELIAELLAAQEDREVAAVLDFKGSPELSLEVLDRLGAPAHPTSTPGEVVFSFRDRLYLTPRAGSQGEALAVALVFVLLQMTGSASEEGDDAKRSQ